MRKLSFVFALSLLTTAAAPPAATIDADCNPGCSSTQQIFNLVGDGYSPNKMYDIIATDTDDALQGPLELGHSVVPDANGHILVENIQPLAADTWTITVFTENHNATPGKKVVAQRDVVFN
jgi:hypothetical protein